MLDLRRTLDKILVQFPYFIVEDLENVSGLALASKISVSTRISTQKAQIKMESEPKLRVGVGLTVDVLVVVW